MKITKKYKNVILFLKFFLKKDFRDSSKKNQKYVGNLGIKMSSIKKNLSEFFLPLFKVCHYIYDQLQISLSKVS